MGLAYKFLSKPSRKSQSCIPRSHSQSSPELSLQQGSSAPRQDRSLAVLGRRVNSVHLGGPVRVVGKLESMDSTPSFDEVTCDRCQSKKE